MILKTFIISERRGKNPFFKMETKSWIENRKVSSTNHEMVVEDHRTLKEKKEVATVTIEGTNETLRTEVIHERSIDGRCIRVTEVDNKQGTGMFTTVVSYSKIIFHSNESFLSLPISLFLFTKRCNREGMGAK